MRVSLSQLQRADWKRFGFGLKSRRLTHIIFLNTPSINSAFLLVTLQVSFLFPGAHPASDLLFNYTAHVIHTLSMQHRGQVVAGYLVIIFRITE